MIADTETPDDLLEEYLTTLRRRRTRLGYRGDLRAFFDTESISISDAKSTEYAHIRQHLSDLAEEKSASTVAHHKAALKSFFRWAEGKGCVPENPFREERSDD